MSLQLPVPANMKATTTQEACVHTFVWMDAKQEHYNAVPPHDNHSWVRHDNFYCQHCLMMQTVTRKQIGPAAPIWWGYGLKTQEIYP